MNLSLPRNGRVVVIDDEIKEGLPLINALSKNGIPTTYFSGKLKELPETPLEDVRIVFLDIVLDETEGQSDKTKISKIIGVMKRIIGNENGPYILIIWSKHNELVEDIKIKLNWNQPVLTLNLEKWKCKDEEDGFDLKKIENKLETEFGNAGIFQLFLLWENIAHQSSGGLINEFTSFYKHDNKYDNDWNKNLTDVFSHLARAYRGKKLDINAETEIPKNGFLAFNGAYSDTFENAIRGYDYSKLKIQFNADAEVSNDICAKINKKLLLSSYSSHQAEQVVQPGNVYFNGEKEGGCLCLKDLFYGDISEADKSKIEYIMLEVSPSCDFAQDKWKLSRLLPGLLWPSGQAKKIKTTPDYVYASPVLDWNNKSWKLVFDFRYLTARSFDELNGREPKFRIRHELLVDIQSHLARHINRPGVFSIANENKRKN